MPSESAVAEPRRLHPISVFFNLVQGLRAMAIPLITALFVGQGTQWMRWLLPFMAIGVIVQPIIKYIAFRYRFGSEGLVVRDGLLTRNERNIPYSRIQNVDIVQNPLHRLFGVAIVKLETASGGTPEAVIRVLSLDAVLEMRRRVAEGRGHDVEGEEIAGPASLDAADDQGLDVASSSLKDLAVHGLVANRGMVVFAAAIGTIWQAGIEPFFERAMKSLADASFLDLPSPRAAAEQGEWLYLATVALGTLAFFVGSLLALSIAWSIVKYGGFSLKLIGDDLRARYGLFTRVQASIPRRRVQRVILRQAPMHRLFRKISAYADTAGSTSGGDGDPVQAERLWLAPSTGQELSRAIASAALGAPWRPEALDWQPLDSRARRRLAGRSWIFAGVLTLGCTLPLLLSSAARFAWIGLAPLLLGALLHLRSHLFVRYSSWALTEGLLVHRSGWLSRRTVIVRLNKVQVIRKNRSPFDRRWGMASLLVDTAGSTRSQTRGIEIAYLPEAVAAKAAERLRAVSARSDFLW